MNEYEIVDRPAPSRISHRPIVHRTRGRGHGEIFRLMSPADLGERLKPFVFLDIFGGSMSELGAGNRMHPHSDIGTITVITDGDVRFDDLEAGHGYLGYGAVEWMRAGGGVWHGKELSSGRSARMRGFQLWVALPPELELGEVESQYIEASEMKQVGPAHVIVGRHEGVSSPVRAPAGINYLLVTLARGQRWTYGPPDGHTVGWLAVAKGGLAGAESVAMGELAVFREGTDSITLEAGSEGATFVLGSAVPHRHELHLGYYSVHCSQEALDAGERRIRELRDALDAQADRRDASGPQPIFRG